MTLQVTTWEMIAAEIEAGALMTELAITDLS
jgi:hypothetical protein